MSATADLYKLLRLMRLGKAIRSGRTGAWARRSVLSTIIAKATSGLRR